MTRRYIGRATIKIHCAGADGYLCRITAGRAAVRLTVWGDFGNTPAILDNVARRAMVETIGGRAVADGHAADDVGDIVDAVADAAGAYGPNGWIVHRRRPPRQLQLSGVSP